MRTIRYLILVLLIGVFVACSSDGKKSSEPDPQPNPVVPLCPDRPEEVGNEELLTLVQQRHFRYGWNFAHPTSGLTREGFTHPDNTVTIGGTGFTVMAIIVGIERGFITREEGVDRLIKMVEFLEKAEHWHGVWPHWMNGKTGAAIAFGTNDDGCDLVETSFLIQGFLTAHQYFDKPDEKETHLRNLLDSAWRAVDWNFFTRKGEKVLYWHWSPTKEWAMNMHIRGWNECLITYILAAASPTHPIDPEVYHNGWAHNGGIINGKEYFGIKLPLGRNYGGPLFFTHYSFLGLDPRGLKDKYADYWEQNIAHAKIHHAFCVANPNRYVNYGADSWGLTASTGNRGYSAHAPDNDRGVIAPTAALSSFPYTPNESMKMLKRLYYELGCKMWGVYGFLDAYNESTKDSEGKYNPWFSQTYLAIDQMPVVIMIENYRTGLLWDLFMTHPDVHKGLKLLDFSSPHLK